MSIAAASCSIRPVATHIGANSTSASAEPLPVPAWRIG
jgi:hypothetical protein